MNFFENLFIERVVRSGPGTYSRYGIIILVLNPNNKGSTKNIPKKISYISLKMDYTQGHATIIHCTKCMYFVL